MSYILYLIFYSISYISYTISFISYLRSSIHMLHLLFSIFSFISYLYLSSLSISHFPLDFFIHCRVFTHSLTHTNPHTSFARSSRNHIKRHNQFYRGGEGRRHEEKCVACFWAPAPTLSLDMASISASRNRRPKSATASLLLLFFCSCCTQILTQFLMHVES